MPKSLGMLEPGDRDGHDCRRALHARMRLLRREHGERVPWRKMNRRASRKRSGGWLKHVVITAVARGRSERRRRGSFCPHHQRRPRDEPDVIIEVLVPDFHAQDWCIDLVLEARPDIFNHNMETVERLTPVVRSRAKYRTSLEVLKKGEGVFAEGGDEEWRDARAGRAGTGVVRNHGRSARDRLPGADPRAISPADAEPFARDRVRHARAVRELRADRAGQGVRSSASGPLVRSSYHAADFHPVVR